ncbi:MAG: hypothetical protein II995_03685 [Oscillospiraceae bacterium]|nr:hypothetical protein [Oscillospiraceae bacterium]
MKKFLSVLLSIAMIASMAVVSMAAGGVAKIGSTEYDSLLDALTAAEDMTGNVVIELLGDVEWETGAAIGSTPLISDSGNPSSVTINGNGNTFTATGAGVGPIRMANGGTLIFNDVVIVDESVSYAEGNWEYGYLEFAGDLEFIDCDVRSAIMIEGESATFENCSFNSNKSKEYAVWVNNGSAEFTDCFFTGPRGIKVHEAYGSDVASLVAEDCTFKDITEKPAFAIGTLDKGTAEVVLTNNTVINCQAGDQGNYLYESDTDIENFEFSERNNWVGGAGIDGGSGIILEGPYIYDSDYDVMLTEAEAKAEGDAFEYGEPVYYLIFDETEASYLNNRKFVEKLKVKAEWNMNGSAVEAVNVVKKYINCEEKNECSNTLVNFFDSGYYYFLEIVTAENKGISDTDVAGSIEFDRKADKKKGVEEIEDCKESVDFTLFYPNTWLTDGTIKEDRADLEWDTPYVLKFDCDEEVELSFGSANGGNNEGTFTVDVSGQGKIYLEYTTEADEAIAAANVGAKLDFLTFNSVNGVGVKFNRTGEFRYEMEDAAYAYRVVDGKLAPIAGLEVEDEEFVFSTNRLEAYVFSNTELVQPA